MSLRWVAAFALVVTSWTVVNDCPAQAQPTASGTSDTEAAKQADPQLSPALVDKLKTPQRTMGTFLDAVDANELDVAALCLDFSKLTITEEARKALEPDYAVKLKGVIDRITRVQVDSLPDLEDHPQPYMLIEGHSVEVHAEPDAAQITIARSEDGLWRFSPETVAAIDDLHERWRDKEKVAGISIATDEPKTFSMWLEDQFPKSLHGTILFLPTYKWICILGVFLLGLAADFLTRSLLSLSTTAWFHFTRHEPAPSQRGVWKPMGLLMQGVTWYYGTLSIGLPPTALSVLLFGLRIFAVLAAVWLCFRLIDFLATAARQRTRQTATRYDDLLVPLVSKTLKLVMAGVGLFICGRAFGLDWLSSVVGGLLAVGGMAVAFASQDAVSNLFGTVTVLLDRPFEVGDWIVTGDVEGTVETVGFRSTRIRTFYNSIVSLPNSKLTTAAVDNMGRRRYRRIKAVLGIQYDSSPEQLDAFCEGIRELIRRHPYTRKDYYHVYFNEFGANSLDILLYCFVDCPDWSVELRERHRLLLDIMRLAEKLGVQFAFPTRTLHLYQEEHGAGPPQIAEPELAGRREAADIAGPLLTTDTRPGPVRFEGPSQVG